MSRLSCIAVLILLGILTLSAQERKDSFVLDQLVVTAQQTPTDTRSTVNTVKVISRQTIESRGVANLGELLQAEANMRISQDAILGGVISINGLQGENIKILIDGVPVVGRLNSNVDLNQISLSNIQRIEIVEGAQSVIYGSDASAGVINLITKKSQTKPLVANVDLLHELNGHQQYGGNISFQKNKFYIQASGHVLQFDPSGDSIAQRDVYWNKKDQWVARLQTKWSPHQNHTLRLSGGQMFETITNLGEIKRPQFKPYAFDEFYNTTRRDYNLFHDYAGVNNWISQFNASYSTWYREKESIRYDIETNAILPIPAQQDTNQILGSHLRWTWASDYARRKLNHLYGVEWVTERAIGDRLLDTTAVDPQLVSNYEIGIFNTYKYKLSSQWTAQAGARYTYNRNFGSAWLPSFWTAYYSPKSWTWKSSVAWGYRSPSLKELYFNFIDAVHYVVGNINLKPEKSINIKTEWSGKQINLNAWSIKPQVSLFYNDVKDRILLTSYGPIEYEYRNIERWTTAGLNTQWTIRMSDRIEYKTNLVYSGYYNVLNTSVDTIPSMSWAVDWSNEVNVKLLNDDLLNLNVWHKRTGMTPIFVQRQNGDIVREVLPSWHMLNANLSTQIIKKKLLLQVGCKNLLDIRQLRPNLGGANHTETGNQQALHWGRNWFVHTIYKF
jgi:outer membrane receptor for ferrienterochelin and colicins